MRLAGGLRGSPKKWSSRIAKKMVFEDRQKNQSQRKTDRADRDRAEMPEIRIGRKWKSNGFFSRMYVRPDLSEGTAHGAGPRWCPTPAQGGPPGGRSIKFVLSVGTASEVH